MDDIDQWIPNILRGKRVPADVVYNIRKNPSLLSPGLTSRRRSSLVPADALRWDDNTPLLWDDLNYLLWD